MEKNNNIKLKRLICLGEEKSMNIIEKICLIKKNHSKFLILAKVGSNYNIYEEDSNIMSYIFGYKIKSIGNKGQSCSFQKTSMKKVIEKLKEKQINYIIVDSRKDYEIIEKVDFKAKNQYNNIIKVAKTYVTLKNNLEVLCQNILDNVKESNFEVNFENIEKVIYK